MAPALTGATVGGGTTLTAGYFQREQTEKAVRFTPAMKAMKEYQKTISEADIRSGKVYVDLLKNPENGNVIYFGDFKNDKPHGEGRIFRTDGTLQYCGEMEHGQITHGLLYDEDGNVQGQYTHVIESGEFLPTGHDLMRALPKGWLQPYKCACGDPRVPAAPYMKAALQTLVTNAWKGRTRTRDRKCGCTIDPRVGLHPGLCRCVPKGIKIVAAFVIENSWNWLKYKQGKQKIPAVAAADSVISTLPEVFGCAANGSRGCKGSFCFPRVP